MSKPETLCTGCGATVTRPGLAKSWRDVAGAKFCDPKAEYPTLHHVSLPPVAIKPEAALEKMIGTEAMGNGNGHFGVHAANHFCSRRGCKPEVSEPKPGSVWVLEKETVRFIKIATEGRNCTSIAIKKSDGSVLSVELHSWIGEDSKPMVQA